MRVGSSRPDSTTTASLRPVGVTCDPVMTVWKERREGKGEERRTEKKKEQSLSHLKTHALSISSSGGKKFPRIIHKDLIDSLAQKTAIGFSKSSLRVTVAMVYKLGSFC